MRITWNGGAFVHDAGGSRWRWCRDSRLWWQTLVLLLLSSVSMCCLLPLFFCSPCQQCSCLSRWLRGGDVAGGGKEEDWWWYAKDAASVSLYFLLLPPAFCWCFSLLFIFFCSFFVHSPLSLSLSRSFSFFFLFSSVHLSRFFFSVPLSLLSSPLFHSPSPLGVRPPFPKLPPCCSVPSLAFIARECMRFPDNKEIVIAEAMVTVGDGRGVRFSLAL